jgi:hypothetical protein
MAAPPAFVEFKDYELDFRYTPPPSMMDLTVKQASMYPDRRVLLYRLGRRGTIQIDAYPREKIGEKNDFGACRAFAHLLVGDIPLVGKSSKASFEKLHFFVFAFQLPQGESTKLIRVYTTIRIGQMLAFTFSAYSAADLAEITASMKTVSSLPRN